MDLLGREGMSLDPQRICDYKDAMVSLTLKMNQIASIRTRFSARGAN